MFLNKIIYIYFPFILVSTIPITLITGPAIPDISLVLVCIIFISYLFFNKIDDLKNNFTYFTLFFWIILLILSLISLNFYKSFGEAFIFLRMLLLPIIMYLWLLKNNNFIKVTLLIILFANLLVLVDTFYQFLNYHPLEGFREDIFFRKAELYGRLSGPFLDMVPGSYISKFFIFGFLGLTLIIKNEKILIFISIFYLTFCGYITFISGERMAVATFLLAMVVSIVILKKFRLVFLFSLVIFLIISFTTYKTHDFFQNFRIIESNPSHLGLKIEKYNPNCVGNQNCSKIINLQPKFMYILKNFNKSAYFETYSLSMEMIKDYPLTGIGINNFNYGCLNIDKFKRDRCWSHPHNFYLQWLTENGLIGFVLFLTYVLFLFYKVIYSEKVSIYSNYSFIALVVIFWPVMSTGSLFKNWYGIETFFIIGLCLSITNFKKFES